MQLGEKTADRFATSSKCVELIKEFAKKITDLNDEEKRDKELAIYSQELGVPVDWFALKRKDKIATVQSKHRDETKKLVQRVAERNRRRAAGLPSDDEEDDDDGSSTVSRGTHRTGKSRAGTVATSRSMKGSARSRAPTATSRGGQTTRLDSVRSQVVAGAGTGRSTAVGPATTPKGVAAAAESPKALAPQSALALAFSPDDGSDNDDGSESSGSSYSFTSGSSYSYYESEEDADDGTLDAAGQLRDGASSGREDRGKDGPDDDGNGHLSRPGSSSKHAAIVERDVEVEALDADDSPKRHGSRSVRA